MRDDIVLLASRLLLAWISLHEGAFLLANYSASSAGMAKMGVPAFTLPLVIALQLTPEKTPEKTLDERFQNSNHYRRSKLDFGRF